MSSQFPVSRRTVLRAGGVIGSGLALGVASTQPAQADPPWFAKLSLEQQVGQRVIFSYPGPDPSDEMFQLIKDGMVGGLIFFGENIPSLSHIADVVADLKAAHAQSPASATPLVLTTDQEGGYIRRLRGQEPILSEKKIGASADPLAEATKAGTGAGEALKAVGMNLNLAPVEDVYREEGNFDDQWERSYSSDPAVCGTLGAAFVRAQQATGVAATAKHYPGLGWATRAENTDLGVVTLTQPAAEIRAVDEFAFTPVIEAGVQLVMTSWATYPAIDPDYPAGLSKIFVGEELRGRQQFRGVTITDALEAGALEPYGDTGERSVLSAEAGMDVLLASGRDVAQGTDAVTAVAAALRSGRLNPGHFKVALTRVQRLRNSLG
ncbi:glycoside hydrolase family 3 [Flexivirga endophytica]|uniref:Glycoside hydrolase family 3 n=1 Tax=Flexivirga endophytica TaxID=1849103 RepID=A0A916T1D3_9MICO|nr:glycoside hydrolase family 3 N-terminal domain-containing protein [Flexivirga endophytica]GGB23481.1 glycoside hydrolase family 3 [Flexivirga endophytica]GHB57415.1 glycoside hydrolase family 3 [Flexivirga endophytica]